MSDLYTVEIRKETQSKAIVLKNVINSYTKGELYCVRLMLEGGGFKTIKYPLCGIFDIVEHEPE